MGWEGICRRALSRMASSTGVVDMVDMSRVRPNALRRSIGLHKSQISRQIVVLNSGKVES